MSKGKKKPIPVRLFFSFLISLMLMLFVCEDNGAVSRLTKQATDDKASFKSHQKRWCHTVNGCLFAWIVKDNKEKT